MPVLSNVLLKRRDFLTETEIKARIKSSKYYDVDRTNPDQAWPLMFFSTSKQRTWLVATPLRLYCILDDLPKDRANVNWSLDRTVLMDDAGTLTADIDVRSKTDRTSLLDLGPKRNWLLTKRLFADSPAEAIRSFLRKAMADEPAVR